MIDFYRSTIGKKFVVAGTGVVLFGFVVGHMLGNLKAFMGMDPSRGAHHLDVYAAFLREMGEQFAGYGTLLWVVRAVLLVCLVLHVATVLQLQARSAAARPEQYERYVPQCSTYAARSMFWGGLFLLLFIVFHLLHLTTGTLHFRGFVEGHVFANVVRAFKDPALVFFYLFAMGALGFHLFHGVWSLFQTFGVESARSNARTRGLALLAALVVALGFCSVPVAVAIGALGEQGSVSVPYQE